MFARENDKDIQPEQLDTVASVWILASNDENPEISYRGLRHRLRLSENVNERQLVARREGCSASRSLKAGSRNSELATRRESNFHLG